MKLFLHGGGGGREDSVELDKKFVLALNLSKPLLYIPIAIDTNKYPYPKCLLWISDLLSPLGVSKIIMWTEDDLKSKTKKDFEQFGGVFIGGGNTFKLLKELKDFGTFEILKNLAENDIPICGGSAGAIILSRTIIPALFADPNDIGLIDFFALNLLQDYDVWCHYNQSMDTDIKTYMKEYDLKKIIAIPEYAGLFMSEKGIEAVGPNVITLFSDKDKIFKPGEFIG